MTRRVAILAGLLASLGGCHSTAAALPALSISNPAANARTLAEAVARLCLRASADPRDFAAALDGIGWPSRKTWSSEGVSTPAVWQLPHVMLIHSEQPIVAPAADVWTCSLSIDRAAAPPEKLLSKMLVRRLIGDAQWSHSTLGLHWKPSLLAEADMDLGKGETGGLSVVISYAQVKPFRALLGK